MIRAIVIDDERDMRLVIRLALSKLDGIEVVGEGQSGEEAVSLTSTLKPQCAFIDVEMPGIGGVEAAKQMLDIDPKLMIIFITAHQQYMPQAFELYAFDYCVKPFKLERIEETIRRMKLLLFGHEKPAIAVQRAKLTRNDKLLIKARDERVLISLAEIILIQRENRVTTIITAHEKYNTSDSLAELEDKLPKDKFIRSHKSYIINIDKIKKISPYGRWTYTVALKGIKEDALLTSEKAKELEQIFGE